MSAQDYKDFLTQFFDAVWNRGDEAAIARFIAPAYCIRRDPGDPWDGQTLDRDGFAERLRVSRAPFPDQHFDIEFLMQEGAAIAAAWRWSGTHLGDIPGFPATGATIRMTGLTIYDVEDGLLTGHCQQTDRLGVFQQLSAARA